MEIQKSSTFNVLVLDNTPRGFRPEGEVNNIQRIWRILQNLGIQINVQVIHLLQGEGMPKNNTYDLVMSSGGPGHVSEHTQLLHVLEQAAQKKDCSEALWFLTCLSHQALAYVLGGKIGKGNGSYGVENLQLNDFGKTHYAFQGINHDMGIVIPKLNTYEVQEVTGGIISLVDAPTYDMLEFGDNILSKQGHLEISLRELYDIIHTRQEKIKNETGLSTPEIRKRKYEIRSLLHRAHEIESVLQKIITNIVREALRRKMYREQSSWQDYALAA